MDSHIRPRTGARGDPLSGNGKGAVAGAHSENKNNKTKKRNNNTGSLAVFPAIVKRLGTVCFIWGVRR